MRGIREEQFGALRNVSRLDRAGLDSSIKRSREKICTRNMRRMRDSARAEDKCYDGLFEHARGISAPRDIGARIACAKDSPAGSQEFAIWLS